MYLQLRRQQLKDVVNLVLETPGQHLVGLVQDEHPDGVRTQSATAQHIIDTARRAHHNMHATLQDAGVLANAGTTHTGMALDLQSQSKLKKGADQAGQD